MNKNKEINDYLSRNTNIENIAVLNQIAVVFNLQKTFCSFFQSDFNDMVNHKKFLELDVVLVLKVLQQPNFPGWYVIPTVPPSVGRRQIMSTYVKKKTEIFMAANKWVSHNIGERKKYGKVLLDTICQF